MKAEHDPEVQELLKCFSYNHLPPKLQSVSKPFHDLAHELAKMEKNFQLTWSLQLLIQSKDCAVRATL